MTSHLKLVQNVTAQDKRKTKAKSNDAKNAGGEMSPQALMNMAVSSYTFDESGITHLTGGSAANGDNCDPIVASGQSEIDLRRIIALYCFPRMPLTFGELHGLLDYCDMMDSAYGLPWLNDKVRGQYQLHSIDVMSDYNPVHAEAIRLYCAGEKEQLMKLHSTEDTLTKIGISFTQYESERRDD